MASVAVSTVVPRDGQALSDQAEPCVDVTDIDVAKQPTVRILVAASPGRHRDRLPEDQEPHRVRGLDGAALVLFRRIDPDDPKACPVRQLDGVTVDHSGHAQRV
jgi:hypothetical protein